MNTFLTIALAATLALGASLSLFELKGESEPVRAEINTVPESINALSIEAKSSFTRSDRQAFANPVYQTFQPVPNPPPSGTDGNGAR
ncbi:MAG: hypothetical protein C4288_06270 [Leptolyngbya sp. ERB_1_1]